MSRWLRRNSRARSLTLAAALLVHVLVLYVPTAPGGSGVPHLDKFVHALAFGGLAWAALRAGLPVGWVLGLLLGHAVLSELLQASLLPGRRGDPQDALADVVGTLLGLAAGVGVGRRSAPPLVAASRPDPPRTGVGT